MLITSFIKEADCGSFVRERERETPGEKKRRNQTDGGNGSSVFMFAACFYPPPPLNVSSSFNPTSVFSLTGINCPECGRQRSFTWGREGW